MNIRAQHNNWASCGIPTALLSINIRQIVDRACINKLIDIANIIGVQCQTMALPQYGSIGTSTIIATGPARDESSSTRGPRRSLADELNQLEENTEQKKRNIDAVRMGQEVNGVSNPKESSNSDVTNSPVLQSPRHTDDVNRPVLFTNDVERQNYHESGNSPPRHIEREMERLIHDDNIDDNQNNVENDRRHFEDSLSRNRSVTNTSTVHTHSEGEECNESDFSVAMSLSTDTITFRRRSRTGSLFSNLLTPRRRRRISRPGAIVTDSYADECICCCSIL